MHAENCRCITIPLQHVVDQQQQVAIVSLATYNLILRMPRPQHTMASTDTTGHCAVLRCAVAVSLYDVMYSCLCAVLTYDVLY